MIYDKRDAAKGNLVDILKKLGLKSVNKYVVFGGGILDESVLVSMAAMMQADFGKPDQLMVSPSDLRRLTKALEKPKPRSS